MLDTTDSYNVSTFYLLNITNGPITFTVTVSPATSFIALAVDEYSGVAAAAALDGHAINFQPNVISLSADSVTSGNITTAAPGDLIWGATMGSAKETSTPQQAPDLLSDSRYLAQLAYRSLLRIWYRDRLEV